MAQSVIRVAQSVIRVAQSVIRWFHDHSVSKSPKELWSFGVLEFGLDFGLRLDFCLTINDKYLDI